MNNFFIWCLSSSSFDVFPIDTYLLILRIQKGDR